MSKRTILDVPLEDRIYILTYQTFEEFLKHKNGEHAFFLYMFYYRNAKIQKTNQVWATTDFCCEGLGWGKARFRKAKKLLLDLNLITEVKERDEKGMIKKHYIKINYIWSKEKTLKSIPQSTLSNFAPVDKQTTNALSSKSINALSSKRDTIEPKGSIPLLDKTEWITNQVPQKDTVNRVPLRTKPSPSQNKTESLSGTLRKHIEGNTYKDIYIEPKGSIPVKISPNRIDKKEYTQFETEITKLWNEMAFNTENISQITLISQERRKKLQARFKEKAFMDSYKKAITKIKRSKFLRGENGSKWVITFDWFIKNGTNCLKVAEGQYDNRY